jgi:hypothetical protein
MTPPFGTLADHERIHAPPDWIAIMTETKEGRQPNENGAHPPQTVAKDAAYRATQEAAELLRSDAGDVTATTVSMDRSGAEQISAERVTMNRSGAKSIETKSAQLERSGVLNLTSENVVLHNSSATSISTKEARVVKSNIAIFRSERTTVEGELRSLLHIGHACDNVKPVFDAQGAARFGAAFAAVLLIGGRVLRLIRR